MMKSRVCSYLFLVTRKMLVEDAGVDAELVDAELVEQRKNLQKKEAVELDVVHTNLGAENLISSSRVYCNK
jgi:hypothetical protein